MKINLDNIIKIDLTIGDDKWSRITDMNGINGKMVFQFKLDGYTAVWLEKINGNHRLIAYTKNGVNHIDGKFLNNISKANQEFIFKMNSYTVPSDSEYHSFLNVNSRKLLDSPQKNKTTKVVKKEKKPTQKRVVANKSKKVVAKKEVLEILSVDAILDKINKNGIGSLTNNEKRFLDEESKKI
jgi:hypothetical protein